MTKVKDIIKIIEDTAPLSLAYSWDNSGFITGDPEKEVKRIYLTLDVLKDTVDDAIGKGADMIISHHPILFRGIQKIDISSHQGYIVQQLIKNDIALYSSHTSMDCAIGGINDVLAEKLGLINTEIIVKSEAVCNAGLGRVGDIAAPMTLGEYAKHVKERLNTPFVRLSGDEKQQISRVAVGSGACGDLIDSAQKMGADVMVTADIKYHIAADAVDSGIAVIDAGHYPTEMFVIGIFEKLLKDTGIEIIKSEKRDVFKLV